jgi:hemerythrin-like domain-containing protein
MVALLESEMEKVSRTNKSDPDFILYAADFFRIYADKCHHGKEEDILFEKLEDKDLEEGLIVTLQELKAEHVIARENVRALREARKKYVDGDPEAPGEIYNILTELLGLYPAHIQKEDKHFFFPAMEYFSKKEQLEMLDSFWEFDEHLIHRVYRDVVEHYESNR